MIPLFAVVRYRGSRGRGITLWIPVFLLWLLLLPLLALLSPVFLIACLVLWLNPIHVVSVFGGIACSLRGTRIEVSHPGQSVLIDVR